MIIFLFLFDVLQQRVTQFNIKFYHFVMVKHERSKKNHSNHTKERLSLVRGTI